MPTHTQKTNRNKYNKKARCLLEFSTFTGTSTKEGQFSISERSLSLEVGNGLPVLTFQKQRVRLHFQKCLSGTASDLIQALESHQAPTRTRSLLITGIFKRFRGSKPTLFDCIVAPNYFYPRNSSHTSCGGLYCCDTRKGKIISYNRIVSYCHVQLANGWEQQVKIKINTC